MQRKVGRLKKNFFFLFEILLRNGDEVNPELSALSFLPKWLCTSQKLF